MDNEILFKEKQGFNQWWLWLILLGVNAFFVFAVGKQIIYKQPFGERPMSDTMLLITTGLIILLTLFFMICSLETIIKNDGIYVRFFPFHISYKFYDWNSISKSSIRTYTAIAEYGGWGLRQGLFSKGGAYTTSGNTGLQLEFTNHKKLLIGTNKATALSEALEKIGQLK